MQRMNNQGVLYAELLLQGPFIFSPLLFVQVTQSADVGQKQSLCLQGIGCAPCSLYHHHYCSHTLLIKLMVCMIVYMIITTKGSLLAFILYHKGLFIW